MVTLTIDGQRTSVHDGATVLDAARAAGISIPTLCHREGYPALTSCMVCLVRVAGQTRFVPSCATRAYEGMVVDSNSDEVWRARRTAVELLLSDHAGDCLAPCQLVCPAHMRIDEMLRLIAAGHFRAALQIVKEHIPLPATLGRICPDLCEKGCRRTAHDGAVSVCLLKRFVADLDLASGDPYLPETRPPSGKRVAIVGAGPAGLSAAYYLLLAGHDVTLYDARPRPGGNLRYAIDPQVLPHSVLDAEIAIIEKLGLRFVPRAPLVAVKREANAVTLTNLRETADAVLLAIGVIDSLLPKSIGLDMAQRGVKVDPRTGMTSVHGVFAAGAAITPHRLAVRAVGDGHHVAQAIDAYVRGVLPAPADDLFSVRLNVLTPAELQVMLAGAAHTARVSEKTLTAAEAIAEAQRCLQCGCEKSDACALRAVATEYGANPLHFRGERRAVAPATHTGEVVFEPGKCIACGKCVQITSEQGAGPGQSYAGRGFDMRIKPPFDASFAEAIRTCAQAVVDACPTAAIRWERSDQQNH